MRAGRLEGGWVDGELVHLSLDRSRLWLFKNTRVQIMQKSSKLDNLIMSGRRQ